MVGMRFEIVTSVLLRIRILSEVTPCHWASSSWCFEWESFGLRNLKDVQVLVLWRHTIEGLDLQHYFCVIMAETARLTRKICRS